MINRTLQESLVQQIIDNISDFDADLLEKLKDTLSSTDLTDETYKEDQFIRLYNETKEKINNKTLYKIAADSDWETIWEQLFKKDGIISRAYRLVPFNTDIVDSSYEDEVTWIMMNWEEAISYINEQRAKNNYFNE